MTVALLATAGRASAQCDGPCPPPVVNCPPPSGGEGEGTPCFGVFAGTTDQVTYIFGLNNANNAIKIGVTVTCPLFSLEVDAITISQSEYAARRDSQFADTVCNPSADDGVHCVFYRVHGETVPASCYNTSVVDYKVFWNVPTMQGNKHDWMLLRAPCDEFLGDTNPPCFTNPPFSQDITTSVDRKPPVGTDPDVGGAADGMSDYIVAISTRHPHKGINK